MEDSMLNTSSLFKKKNEEKEDWENTEDWEPVSNDRRKKKILPKTEPPLQVEEEEEVDLAKFEKPMDPIYRMSELIQNNVCIHCMGMGKCREGTKDHGDVYFPDEIREFIMNPRKISSLNEFLKKNVPKNDLFKSYTLSYTICLFNHCRKHCKHCRAGRSGILKDQDGTELWYCYPELTRVQKNRTIILGLHIDLELKIGSSVEALWKPDHCPILSDDEKTESSSFMTPAKLTVSDFPKTVEVSGEPMPLASTEWLDIAKKAPSRDAILSPISNVSSSSGLAPRGEERKTFVRNASISSATFEEMKNLIHTQCEMIERLMKKSEMMEQSMLDLHVRISEIQKENRVVREEFEYNQTYRDIRSLLKEGNQLITEKIMKTHHYRYMVIGEYF